MLTRGLPASKWPKMYLKWQTPGSYFAANDGSRKTCYNWNLPSAKANNSCFQNAYLRVLLIPGVLRCAQHWAPVLWENTEFSRQFHAITSSACLALGPPAKLQRVPSWGTAQSGNLAPPRWESPCAGVIPLSLGCLRYISWRQYCRPLCKCF